MNLKLVQRLLLITSVKTELVEVVTESVQIDIL